MKRYALHPYDHLLLQEDPQGEWVKWEDVDALVKQAVMEFANVLRESLTGKN